MQKHWLRLFKRIVPVLCPGYHVQKDGGGKRRNAPHAEEENKESAGGT